MKMKNIFVTLAGLALLGGASIGIANGQKTMKAEATVWRQNPTIYFVPSTGWAASSATFKMNYYDNAQWKGKLDCSATGETYTDGRSIYSATVSDGSWVSAVQFLRMSGETELNYSGTFDISDDYSAGYDMLVMAQNSTVESGWTTAHADIEWVSSVTVECLIKGTVASLSMDNDSTGQSIGDINGNQFEITNLQLATTDSFNFSIAAWGLSNAGYSALGNKDSQDLFDSSESNLVPLTAGYYNFYVQAEHIYVTKSDKEDVEDGYYLRGSELGWTGAPLALTGSGPYTCSRTFVAGEKVQMVHYVDGLPTYVPATSVVAADANYFPANKNGADAEVTNAGTYTLSITAAGVYTFTDTASAWCREFLDSMTCDANGVNEPQFVGGHSWSNLGTSFAALDEIARNAINGATAVEDGSVIQEAVSRYDTIVANHGYTKFIKNSSDVYRTATNGQSFAIASSNNAMIIVLISAAVVSAVAAFYFLSKKKESK